MKITNAAILLRSLRNRIETEQTIAVNISYFETIAMLVAAKVGPQEFREKLLANNVLSEFTIVPKQTMIGLIRSAYKMLDTLPPYEDVKVNLVGSKNAGEAVKAIGVKPAPLSEETKQQMESFFSQLEKELKELESHEPPTKNPPDQKP